MASLFLAETRVNRSRYLYMETRRRAFAKALSYRLFGATAAGAVVLALTGRLGVAVSVGLLDCVLKIILYYVHERIWSRFGYGRADN